MGKPSKDYAVPLWEKANLTVYEAAAYSWIPFGIPLKQGQTMYSNGTKTEKAGKKNGTQIKNNPWGYAGTSMPA